MYCGLCTTACRRGTQSDMFTAHIDAEPQRTKKNVSREPAQRLHIGMFGLGLFRNLLPILEVFFLIEDEGAVKVWYQPLLCL